MEPVVLQKCIVCGAAWPSRQSLRAHMKKHRHEGYFTTHIFVRREEWQQFKDVCHKHNSTTCHVLKTLINAFLKGEETGLVSLATPNPIIINVSETFMGKPRSTYKVRAPSPADVSVGSPGSCADCGGPAEFRAFYYPAGIGGRCITSHLCSECLRKHVLNRAVDGYQPLRLQENHLL